MEVERTKTDAGSAASLRPTFPGKRAEEPALTIDWNDESVRDTARFIVHASNEILGAAAQFAPGHENEFLEAMSDAMVCDHDGCDCGGADPGHWPLPFENQCSRHQHCPCGGHYHRSGLALQYS